MCTACACDTAGTGSTRVETGGESVYRVEGMTCGHCVSAVSTEIGEVGGVTGVRVDLATGAVTVGGSGFSDEEIRAAVDRAGYALAGPLSAGAS
ncbi:heavy-metal-associated domain-containing protein [Streptosporangium sp. NPDC050855]|uniref:heavy-metal-associated domain-containing protein n=1 Tax=Streptosporangium sp. NPDC050855 TaxID=3366194 RepID=UPI0037AE3ABC